jgi:hypothetical protein
LFRISAEVTRREGWSFPASAERGRKIRARDAILLIDRMASAVDLPDFAAVAVLDREHVIGFAYGYTDTRLAALDPAVGSAHSAFELIPVVLMRYDAARS